MIRVKDPLGLHSEVCGQIRLWVPSWAVLTPESPHNLFNPFDDPNLYGRTNLPHEFPNMFTHISCQDLVTIFLNQN